MRVGSDWRLGGVENQDVEEWTLVDSDGLAKCCELGTCVAATCESGTTGNCACPRCHPVYAFHARGGWGRELGHGQRLRGSYRECFGCL